MSNNTQEYLKNVESEAKAARTATKSKSGKKEEAKRKEKPKKKEKYTEKKFICQVMYVFAVECYVIRLEFQFLSTED